MCSETGAQATYGTILGPSEGQRSLHKHKTGYTLPFQTDRPSRSLVGCIELMWRSVDKYWEFFGGSKKAGVAAGIKHALDPNRVSPDSTSRPAPAKFLDSTPARLLILYRATCLVGELTTN